MKSSLIIWMSLESIEHIPRKRCCPNACPALDDLRSKLRLEVLKSTTSPIGFEEADQERVLESVHDDRVMTECGLRLLKLLVDTGVSVDYAKASVGEMIMELVAASSYEELNAIGLNWNHKFEDFGFSEPIEKLMMERNHWVAQMIAPKLLPGTALDHDSGDSYVARFIQMQRQDVAVSTQDAFDFRGEIKDLPIVFYDYGDKVLPYPAGTQFDNVILATVLHHCDEPEKMFDAVVELLRPGGRLFLLENVFKQKDVIERGVNVFFDWFFNQVFHRSGLPLPFSHFCREQWKEFLEYKGFHLVESHENLGRWPSIPLEHVLYVVEKK